MTQLLYSTDKVVKVHEENAIKLLCSEINPMRPNRELVVYCLNLACGTTERVHIEDLALKCWELFPDSFSWTKYPKYPDKDIVRVALTDARKEQNGAPGRVEGKASGVGHAEPEGWLLTDRGIAWINNNLSLLAKMAGGPD